MARTILDFNAEYTYQRWREDLDKAKKPRRGTWIKNALFYSALIGLILFAFFYMSDKSGGGKKFGSLSYYKVLTTSMQSVYPQGALVVAWDLEPDEPLTAGLENGTDIVFLKDEDNTVIVHRIIEVMEDYEGQGVRAFQTQGVNNNAPDPWITDERNVLGRVVWHMAGAGDVLAYISEHIILTIAGVVALFVLLTMLRYVLTKDK